MRTVSINGHNVDAHEEAGGFRVQLTLEPGRAAEIRIGRGQLDPAAAPLANDRLYEAKVFLRRTLSEFRDNYWQKSPFLASQSPRGRLPKTTLAD